VLRIKEHTVSIIEIKDATIFLEKMEELENPFDPNDIDENLYYPIEEIEVRL